MTPYPYEKPRQWADDLWELRGAWSNKFGRRMTVIRSRQGDVFVHHAIQLAPEDLAWLRGLGSVRAIIAPNKFHCSDAAWMAAQFPAATLFVPQPKLREFAARGLRPKDVASEFPREVASELECIPMHGTRVAESAFVHHASRTLVLCDLAFNMEDVFTGAQRTIMRWNKVGGRFGPSRATRLLFTSDRRALVASYRRLLEHDFDRVIVNHGAVLPSGGRELLKSSVAEVFAAASDL